MGFEPTRAEPIGLAVQRLNHSATSSSGSKSCKNSFKTLRILSKLYVRIENDTPMLSQKNEQKACFQRKGFPRRELNPGLLGESQVS